jgi:hypothetical protein
LQRKGKHLILSGPHSQPLFMMQRADFVDRLGTENVCATFEDSLLRAKVLLEQKKQRHSHGHTHDHENAHTATTSADHR